MAKEEEIDDDIVTDEMHLYVYRAHIFVFASLFNARYVAQSGIETHRELFYFIVHNMSWLAVSEWHMYVNGFSLFFFFFIFFSYFDWYANIFIGTI